MKIIIAFVCIFISTISNAETFEEFFDKFKSNSTFQVSRTTVPLEYFSLSDTDPEEVDTAKWGKEQIEAHVKDYGFIPRELDEHINKINSESTDVYFNKADTDFSLEFYFKKNKAGLWYLYKYGNMSL